jgi:hypothetical protein
MKEMIKRRFGGFILALIVFVPIGRSIYWGITQPPGRLDRNCSYFSCDDD